MGTELRENNAGCKCQSGLLRVSFFYTQKDGQIKHKNYTVAIYKTGCIHYGVLPVSETPSTSKHIMKLYKINEYKGKENIKNKHIQAEHSSSGLATTAQKTSEGKQHRQAKREST